MGLGAGLGTPSSLHPPTHVPTVCSWLLFLQGAVIVICHVYERVCISGREGTQILWRTVGMGPPWVGPLGPPAVLGCLAFCREVWVGIGGCCPKEASGRVCLVRKELTCSDPGALVAGERSNSDRRLPASQTHGPP